jgi:murein DD-endopeptidase MepM/ murein hydrolase activator NlpD
MTTWLAALVAVVWSAAPPAIDVALDARAIQPGEIVVVTMTVRGVADQVSVTAFEKSMPVFKSGEATWTAIVGVDLEQKPGRYTIAIDATGGPEVAHAAAPLVVMPRRFQTRRLRVDPSFVTPPPAELARVEMEAAFTRDVYANSAAERLWSSRFVRPVPQRANSSFGSRSVFNGVARAPHAGTDFLSPAGTPVAAPNSGRVVCARDLYFTGNTVIIDHGLGVFSLLAHLSQMDVQEGQPVTAGQVIGLVGATGRVTGPHLHWAVRVAGARVDALSALAVLR